MRTEKPTVKIWYGRCLLLLSMLLVGALPVWADGKHASTVEREPADNGYHVSGQKKPSAADKGSCVNVLKPPKTDAECHLSHNDPSARFTVTNWYCTSKPAEDMRAIDKLLRSLLAGGKDAGAASIERGLEHLGMRAEAYLRNRGTPPQGFWQALVPGPWVLDPPPGMRETRRVRHCFTDRELEIMKWEAISWAEGIQRHLEGLGRK